MAVIDRVVRVLDGEESVDELSRVLRGLFGSAADTSKFAVVDLVEVVGGVSREGVVDQEEA